MIIECENIRLSLITEADLEMMRNWRNADHVNREMEFREIIDSESQQRWFNEMDKKTNFYFRLDVSDEPIGILNLKNIDWVNNTAEAGVFIGNELNLGTISPVLAVIIMMDFAFEILGIRQLQAKIADSNTNAIEFNSQLGYQPNKKLNPGFSEYSCNRESFYHASTTVTTMLQRIKHHATIKISMGRNMEWLLPQMEIEKEGYLFLHL